MSSIARTSGRAGRPRPLSTGRPIGLRRSAPQPPVAMIEVNDVPLSSTGRPGGTLGGGLSLRAYSGRIVNVVSAGGAAQELLAMLSGRLVPGAGVFSLGGIELKQLSEAHRRRLLAFAVGAVFPHDGFPPLASVVDGVAAPMLAQGLPPLLARVRAQNALDMLCFTGPSDLPPRPLSVAEERLALLARALSSATAVLVCVEPELGLSPAQAGALRQALYSAARDGGRCVVLNSADERFASLADSTLWL